LLLNLARVFTAFGLAVMLACLGCNRSESAKQSDVQPLGEAEPTCQFWQSLHEAAISGIGIEALESPAWQGDVDTADMCGVIEDLIAGERERSRAITSLPVLHVAPDLAEYAVEFAKSRTELADAMQDYVGLMKKQAAMTSAPVLGIGLLENLIEHKDDKQDGILWPALLDTARQTGENLKTLQAPASALEARVTAVRGSVGRLNAEEMGVRVKLAQRFDREFPPSSTYTKTAASENDKDRPLSKNQIIPTLIGRKIGGLFNWWTFDSPQEFVTFNILSVKKRSDVLTDYEVQTHVKGIPSGDERDFALHLSYGWIYTRWKLVELRYNE
jgi:hypothetical protein